MHITELPFGRNLGKFDALHLEYLALCLREYRKQQMAKVPNAKSNAKCDGTVLLRKSINLDDRLIHKIQIF